MLCDCRAGGACRVVRDGSWFRKWAKQDVSPTRYRALSAAQASADCYVGDRSFAGLMFNAGDGKRCLQREVIPAGNEGLLWQ